MEEYPKLLVLAYQQGSLQAIIRHLREVGLAEHCRIEGVLTEKIKTEYSADLVLATNQPVYNMGERFLRKNTPYIIGERAIDFSKIKELLSLPADSRIYLVSNMRESAIETIDSLKEIGINHNYVPYYGQRDVDPTIKVAVTAGETSLVPPSVQYIIDIGHRLLHMRTLFEIYEFLGFSAIETNNQLTSHYIQSIESLTSNLNQQILQTRGMHKSLEGTVDQIDEGLIVYDQADEIVTINSPALKLLEWDNAETLLNQNINTIPKSFYEAFMQVDVGKENFIDVEKVPYYIRKKRVFVGSEVFTTIIIFQEIEQIRKIETKYMRSTQSGAFTANHSFSDMKTNSGNMKELIAKAKKMADSNSTIFIHGETGTGKEVMAQAIHSASNRSAGPFVAVNLAAIAESLVESELFGYERGAFTGARQEGNPGLFEKAHRGTVFLDEIGDASPNIQKRLLRVLQEREIQRVGGGPPIPVDIRVIAATNRDLQKLIKEGKFRADLYYRLNILPIELIPLRNRKNDILLLSELFLKEFAEKLEKRSLKFANEAMGEFLNYDWPGNVRELRNTIEYLAHICDSVIDVDDLPFSLKKEKPMLEFDSTYNIKSLKQDLKDRGFLEDLRNILHILKQENGQGMGRYKLLKIISKKDRNMSEQKLRYRMELLAEFDLIDVGRGRQGSTLNSRGEEFLLYLRDHY